MLSSAEHGGGKSLLVYNHWVHSSREDTSPVGTAVVRTFFCLLGLACSCQRDMSGAGLLFQIAGLSCTRLLFFPHLGAQCGNIIILNDVTVLGERKILFILNKKTKSRV